MVRVVKLLNLLGAYFGLPKCRFRPSQEGEWLGFEIISPEKIFRVSEKKMAKVKAALARFLQVDKVTPRQLAAIAGKLISLSPAVLPASLYSRAFFEAIQGKASWDEIFAISSEIRRTVQEWLDNPPSWNGRRWYAKPISLLASSDASDFGFGGIVSLTDGRKVQVAGSLTEAEIQMSSTAREVVGFLWLLEATAQLYPEVIRDSTIQLIGDNQGAVQAVNQFRSRAPDVARALKEIYQLCVASSFSISPVWQPRDLLVTEDLLSRQADASDWGIRRGIFEAICSEFRVSIAIDLFASDTWHVAPRFVSHILTPGCVASQALLLDWGQLLKKGDFAWIFLPVRVISEVVQLIERYRTNCILLVPEQKAANRWDHLFSLPLAEVIQPYPIPRGTVACRASRRVPSRTANPGLFNLRALKIVWPAS